MSFLTSLAKRAVSTPFITARLIRLKRTVVRVAIGGTLLTLFGVLGLAHLLAALRVWLEQFLGFVWSPVAIGAVFMLAATAAYLVFLRPERGDRARDKTPKNSAPTLITQLHQGLSSIPVAKIGIALAGGAVAALGWRFFRKRDLSRLNGEFPAARPWAREIVLRETRPRSR